MVVYEGNDRNPIKDHRKADAYLSTGSFVNWRQFDEEARAKGCEEDVVYVFVVE